MSTVLKKPITAPPSTAYKIVDVPEIHRDVIERHAVPGTFVAEKDSPWVPFGPNAAIRHVHFDVRHNIFSNVLWVKSAGVVGTHKHRGTVVMMCMEGSVRYLEYDWVAHAGDFIYETPGLTHTLVSDDPKGVKLFGWLQGRSSSTTSTASWRRGRRGGSSTTTRPTAARTASHQQAALL
jgi:hypothetical protein